jgi:hypothetical protein
VVIALRGVVETSRAADYLRFPESLCAEFTALAERLGRSAAPIYFTVASSS